MEIFTFGRRTAVVTGGSKNIGLAIALKFAHAGINVAVISSTKESLAQAKIIFENEGVSALFVECDVSKVEAIDGALDVVIGHYGSIDILVNCAGVLDLNSIEDTTEDAWDHVLDVNLKSIFFMVKKCVPYLKKGAAPRIINIASNSGRMGGYANGMSYTASKGGVISLTYGLARKLAPFLITVNCVAPGTIDSDMSRSRSVCEQEQLLTRFPLGRIGTADEVASAVCYFASIESSFTTGAVLDVNGGLFMG